jgi:hypothetical protein
VLRRCLWILLALFCFVQRAEATVLSGTISYPNGSPVTGTLTVTLERSGLLNTCVTPSVVASTAPITISIVAGAVTGSPNITPTDCLSSFQPYLAVLKDNKNTQLFRDHWYVTLPGGGTLFPLTGSKFVYPSGLALSSFSNDVVYVIVWPSGYKTATSPVAFVGANFNSFVSFNWPSQFKDTNYFVVCTVFDVAAPLAPLVQTGPNAAFPGPSIFVVKKTGVSVAVFNSDMSNTRSYYVVCRAREP